MGKLKEDLIRLSERLLPKQPTPAEMRDFLGEGWQVEKRQPGYDNETLARYDESGKEILSLNYLPIAIPGTLAFGYLKLNYAGVAEYTMQGFDIYMNNPRKDSREPKTIIFSGRDERLTVNPSGEIELQSPRLVKLKPGTESQILSEL